MSREDRRNERERTAGRKDTTDDTNVLRPAELGTLALIAAGHTYKTAALEQGVTVDTIHDHLTACRERLGARTTAHAVSLAILSGQLEP